MEDFALTSSVLSSTFAGSRWEPDDLIARGQEVIGQPQSVHLRRLVARLMARFGSRRRPSERAILEFLQGDSALRRWTKRPKFSLNCVAPTPPAMFTPFANAATWGVPAIVTVGELAEWLQVTPIELEWLAGRRGRETLVPGGSQRRYHYHWLMKRRAGSARLIEAPKPWLKRIQRQILHGILDRIPPHRAAQGYYPGRSIQTFVEPHVGQAIVFRTDLRDFFPSVLRRRVAAVFRTAGYPDPVCQYAASLCTNQAPPEIWDSFPQFGDVRDRWRHEELYLHPHLPQGSPTSPALANLCAYRLDCRLSGLSQAFQANYTRYADDLLFSGPRAFAQSLNYFRTSVYAIIADEGFVVNTRKSRTMSRGGRQQAAGLVLNDRPNIPRNEYDNLKAILFNCARTSPQEQNRERHPDFRAHLQGRVAYVESVNSSRGGRLRKLFDAIRWT